MNPFRNLRRFLPEPETLQNNRWLRWLGPRLLHPRLWHFSRRGVALGVALGVFFGLLVPIAQIPLSAGAAVLLRANLPAAAASTLVTNPVTFPPVYYAAWKLGGAVLGAPQTAPPPVSGSAAPGGEGGWRGWIDKLTGVGKPLVVGLALMACGLGLAVYFVISWGWALRVRWARQRRCRALATSGLHSSHKK
jgi:uncharacterized protein